MLKSGQWIDAIWHWTNKKHFESLGYIFTNYGDVVKVKAEDLTPNSHYKVVVICDYCGREVEKSNSTYNRQHDDELGDACRYCQVIKQQKILMREYGVSNPSELPAVQQKRKATIMARYGCENPSQIEGVQAKKEATCMKNYGVRAPLQSKEIRERVAKTTLKHGNCPTSSQQYAVYEMLKSKYGNCELNKQCSKNILDCVLQLGDILIDVEYDGSYWHQDPQKDRRRDEVVKSYGYKILRIRGGHDIPTLEQLEEAILYLLQDGHNFTTIKLNK